MCKKTAMEHGASPQPTQPFLGSSAKEHVQMQHDERCEDGKTYNGLVPKLVVSKILAPEKVIKSDKPAVTLKWGRSKKKNQGCKVILALACEDDDLWKHVPGSGQQSHASCPSKIFAG
jgi:hypothetical protein